MEARVAAGKDDGGQLPPSDEAIEARQRLARQGDPMGLRLRGKERKRFEAQRPRAGHGRQQELGTRDIVAPYAVGGTRRAETVAVNVRETPLEHMYARGKITDAEKRAGDVFRGLCEAVEIGGGVIDPARIKVDSSGAGDPLTERAIKAAKELDKTVQVIGHTDYLLLHEVCAAGWSLLEIARRWYAGLEDCRRAREAGSYLGRRVREALAQLVTLWGLDGRASNGKTRGARGFTKAEMRPEEWTYDPAKAKAENKAREKRRRKKR